MLTVLTERSSEIVVGVVAAHNVSFDPCLCVLRSVDT